MYGSGGGNRTPTNGFGDRRTAIILHRNCLVSRKNYDILTPALSTQCSASELPGPVLLDALNNNQT